MSRVKRLFPELPFITASANTKILVGDANDFAFGYTHINTLIDTMDSNGLATDGENVFSGDQLVLGNLTINGDIVANNFVTSSTLLFTGSTNHGSHIANIHTYTGSVRISGSLNTIGNATITGSFLVSGSTTQIGNNTLDGNTILSGSISVSGSQLFKGTQTLSGSFLLSGSTFQQGNNTLIGANTITGSNSLLGNNSIIGDNLIVGDTVLSGSFEVSGSFTGSMNIAGNLNIASGSAFYRWGNKLFNYGAFYSTITQSGSANVSQSMSYNNTDYSEGISIVNGSQITLENVGVYNIQFSAQIVDTGGGDSTIRIWLKKNGTNVPNTATKIFLQSNKELVAAWNWIVPATSPNDYYVIAWQTTDNDAHILYEPASGNYPAIPSIILTVTQVA